MIKEICPECEKIQPCEEVKEYTLPVRGEEITVPVNMYKCNVCGEIFTPFGSDEDIFDKAYRIYREKHGMLQPEEIKALRKKYGLTQQELANILGIGLASINRYEKGSLQESSHDNLLQVLKKPKEFLSFLEKNKHKLTREKYQKIKQKILEEMDNNIFEDLRHIEEKINNYDEIYRGKTKFSMQKFIGLIEYILKRAKKLNANITKTKLNKLLYFCDFKFFQLYQKSITGMIYAHLPYGPCPENYHTIYGILVDKGIIDVKEEYYDENYVIEKLEINKIIANQDFTIEEEKIINEIIDSLAVKSAKELSDLSHEEEGYKNTKNGEFISYN